MSYTKPIMDDDEEGVLLILESVLSNFHAIMNILQSPNFYRKAVESLNSKEVLILLICTAILLVSLIRLKNNRLSCWLNGITNFTLLNSFRVSNFEKGSDWSEEGDHWHIHSSQGKRACNEDRAVAKTIQTENGAVHLYSVMDGHGGDFCVNFVYKDLISRLELKIKKIKLITSKKDVQTKTALYQKEFGKVPESVLNYWNGGVPTQTTEQNGKVMNGQLPVNNNNKIPAKSVLEKSSSEDSTSATESSSEDSAEKNGSALLSRDQIVLSTGRKALEELPTLKKADAKLPEKPVKKKEIKKALKGPRSKTKEAKKGDEKALPESELVDYIGSNGDVLYAKLLREQILACDKELIKKAKKANAIGGTTLLVAVVDKGTLWVANVGDSRGIYCTETGQVGPLSFDHKPSQLKEKRRIQAAGGFISLIGVWRVQGILATSRALGDYPLKDKNVIIADPDILSFNIKDLKLNYAVLASDGLWDTHSNDEVADFINNTSKYMTAASMLVEDSLSKGSQDNVTVLLVNLNKLV